MHKRRVAEKNNYRAVLYGAGTRSCGDAKDCYGDKKESCVLNAQSEYKGSPERPKQWTQRRNANCGRRVASKQRHV